MADQELTKTEGYPLSKRMSAKFEGTFAYVTLKERMPKILTQVIDTVHREEASMNEKYGEAGTEDVKTVLSTLSELRYNLMTNKVMEGIEEGKDVSEWRAVFKRYRENLKGKEPEWFNVSWLFAECYMYRKIAESFQKSAFMKEFDPFQKQKETSFVSFLSQISSQASRLCRLISPAHLTQSSEHTLRVDFEHLVLLCLWGNKVDLSMMATMDDYDITLSSSETPQQAQALRTNILADHTAALWGLLQIVRRPRVEGKPRRVDFVIDNAGLEIFTDICLAEWFLSAGLADVIYFHCKQLPWFVSDALIKDFMWTLNSLASSSNESCSTLGRKWKERVEDGSFVVIDHSFWTTSHEYAAMETIAPDLYNDLKKSCLVLFKGDLNYRKLLADRNWLYTEEFSMALGGFLPTSVCALRTLKADLVTGLPSGVAAKAASENKDWMITGQYAVLQVAES